MYFVYFLFLFSAYNYLNTCPVCSGPVVLVFSFNEVLYLSKKISNHNNINCKYLSWFGIASQSDECIICKDWMGNVEIFVYQIHCATWLKTPSTALEINLLKASITKTKKWVYHLKKSNGNCWGDHCLPNSLWNLIENPIHCIRNQSTRFHHKDEKKWG